MNLERMFTEWQAIRLSNPAQAQNLIAEVTSKVVASDESNMKWLTASLGDEKRRFFVAALFAGAQAMPDSMLQPMLRAAVYETSPLRVQAFVEPCVKAFGVKKVFQHLIEYLEKGTNFEKAGAVNALHWTGERKSKTESGRHRPNVEMMAMDDYRRLLYLNTFINNPDLDVRRSTLTYSDLDTVSAPPAAKELIDKVIKIARAHPDEYIRHRIEVQLGRSPSAYPLPDRKRIDAATVDKKSWWKQLWK